MKNKIVLEAVAVSSAIIKATEHKATVLVFVNRPPLPARARIGNCS